MQLLVGKRPICLPSHQCLVSDVKQAVDRINPPFMVNSGPAHFAVRRRVFLLVEDVRVECENEGELGLACKLIAEDHNKWQEGDHQACADETHRMEQSAQAHMEAESSDDEDDVDSEEDISIQEWGQMGYKWFKREDVAYI